jgi:leader peptidase (prepilin peptidase)/N-methyltransferase
MRYFWVELFTGLGFVGLFYLEMVLNIHQWPAPVGQAWAIRAGFFPWQWWVGYVFHLLLFCFLMVAAFCDLHGMYIPIRVTMTGMMVGLVGAVLMPWPWPYTPTEALAPIRAAEMRQFGGKEVAWWGPLPEFLKPGGNWQTGLATGIAGILVGTFMLRAMAFLFSKGLGREALGLGDADLMMMAGAFVGWQIVVVAFFVSVFPALFFGVYQIIARRDTTLPFGPSLAMGTIITMLCWRWIGPPLQMLFFFPHVLIALAVLAGVFMLVSSYMIRMVRPAPKA